MFWGKLEYWAIVLKKNKKQQKNKLQKSKDAKIQKHKKYINNKSNPINTNIILAKTRRRKKSNTIIQTKYFNRKNELYNQNATKLPKRLAYEWF